jgi:hypothetical protein
MMRKNGNGMQRADEEQELEWAAELLSVNSEAEMEQFLGDIVKSVGNALGGVGKAVSSVVQSPVFQKLGGVLKDVAKVGLPIAGRVAGSVFGGPIGGMIGGGLGSLASNALGEQEAFLGDLAGALFGGELEQMEASERELEAAKRVIKLATTAAQEAAAMPPASDAQRSAIAAVESAAHKLGFVPAAAATAEPRNAGRWVRRGNQLVIYGA